MASNFVKMKYLFLLILGLTIISCHKKNEDDLAFQLTYPSYFPTPVYEFENNELTKARFDLGKKLFFDKQLSSNGTISCNSCHAQGHAFADHNVSLSEGVNGAIGTRNSPSLSNMIWSPSFMWDGGVNHIEVFSVAPITNPLEMNETMSNVISKLNNSSEYKNLFKIAYGIDNITDQAMLRALTMYMSMMVSCNSKYDKVRQGKVSFSSDEADGYELFKQKCASCHSEPLFTNYQFVNNGLDSIFTDLGRGEITFNANDNGKFKVPSLRNVELTYPYMHDGRFWSLNDVLDHYDHGIKSSSTLAPSLQNGIPLTVNEKTKLIAFLKTLTDYDLLGNSLFY
jgi:cytochrome c peroxidase